MTDLIITTPDELRALIREAIESTSAPVTPQTLTMAELKTRLRLSEPTIRRLVRSGRLRRVPDLPGTLLVTRESVERLERGEE